MNHALVTVAIPFAAEKTPAVCRILDELGNPAGSPARAALDASSVVHFMSASAVAGTAPGRAHMFVEISADGSPDDALQAVCAAIGPTLARAIEAGDMNRQGLPVGEVLKRHSISIGPGFGQKTGLAFDGSVGFSVWRIRNEARIAETVTATMSDVLGDARLTPTEKLQQVRNRLWAANEKWAFTAEPALVLDGMGTDSIPGRAAMALVGVLQFLWWIFPIAALAGVWAGWRFWWLNGVWTAIGTFVLLLAIMAGAGLMTLRRLEDSDPVDDTPPDAAKVESFLRHENIGAQNLLPAMSVVKVGWFRRVVLRLAFTIAAIHVKTLFRVGFLRDIGVIHFARWALIPGTDRLMFWSNFSDGWESYLEDFINKAGDGLTAIWSNTIGFPRTRWLILGGAADGDKFRRWARRQQYAVSFWYSAYPQLKMTEIRRNAAIRQGISSARTTPQAENWLDLFGSEPRPPFMLQKTEVPTLVLGGLRRMRFATCLVIRLPATAASGQAWLRQVEPSITFGEAARDERAGAIAFSAHGLARLGVTPEDLATFSTPFQNGMTSPGRAQSIGDTGDRAPQTWLWGQADQTDAVLLLYETDAARLEETVRAFSSSLVSHGGAVAFEQRLRDLPADPSAQIFEPFGFADGLSQPILRDSPRARRADNADHVVEAGEFLFGYPDNTGYIPDSPTLAARCDPTGVMTESGAITLGVDASFEGGGSNGRRDFGRNGSFLVVRHLEQHVDAFEAFAATTAERLSSTTGCPFSGSATDDLAVVVKAKMLGRWPNGRSLVRHAYPDEGHAIDNDFTFQREDPQGLACPLGAHIRRANPRDSVDTTSLNQLVLSNRHRILRIGRPYEAPAGGQPGLLFMCLNTDIERQFEFLQQTWILGPSFHDLNNENDPMLGHNSGEGVFTIPTRTGPVRLTGLPDFVSVRGGGYFFMPGRRSLQWLACNRTAAAPAALSPPAAAVGVEATVQQAV